MAKWYDKYLSIYGKPFSEVPQEIIDGTRQRLAALNQHVAFLNGFPVDAHAILILSHRMHDFLPQCGVLQG